MNKFLQENIIWFFLPIIALGAGIFFIVPEVTSIPEIIAQTREAEETLKTKEFQLQEIRAKKAKAEKEPVKKKEPASGKVIYEVLGQQFSADASFGIMFENILANMTNSGVRIRSIDYNYSPLDDKIITLGVPGYNACELSFTAVSTYAQLQRFFKNLAKEKYLSSIQEVYIEPFDKDKSILISKFKIRIYPKTI